MKICLRGISFLILALGVACALHARVSAETEGVSIKAEGRWTKTAEQADVKKKAMEDALKNAVMEAVVTVTKNERLSPPAGMVESIAANYVNYVVNYRIISEGWLAPVPTVPKPPDAIGAALPLPALSEPDTYRIWIEASVDVAMIREAIAASGRDVTTSPASVVILGMPDYRTFNEALSAMGRVQAIRETSYVSFSRSRHVMKIKAAAPLGAVAGALSRELGPAFIVFDSDPAALVIKYMPANDLLRVEPMPGVQPHE